MTMKKISKSFQTALFILLFISGGELFAQTDTLTPQPEQQQRPRTYPGTYKRTPKKQVDNYFDESGDFKHRLWYGGNFGLGFNGYNGSSRFNISVTPMVGYKISKMFSVGPIVGIGYANEKYQTSQTSSIGFNLVDYSIGAFGRAKIFKNFFLHVEESYASRQYAQFDNSGNPAPYRINRSSTYAGAGYNSGGGGFGYEILLLYNFDAANDPYLSSFEPRFGFTYNF